MPQGVKPDTAWTDERVEKLKVLHANGYSFSEIAAELGGGISRNGAIGKAHRLGLDGRKVPFKAPAGIKPEPFVIACVEVEPRHLTFANLQENDCRFSYGDGPFSFCGLPKVAGSSYCGPHHRVCSGGVPPRRGRPHSTKVGEAA